MRLFTGIPNPQWAVQRLFRKYHWTRPQKAASVGKLKSVAKCPRGDSAIVAWHEVPGTSPHKKGRPEGYGVIRAGVRTGFDDWRDATLWD